MVRALIALFKDTGLLRVTVESNRLVNEHELKGRAAPAAPTAPAANAAPEVAARAKKKLVSRFAPIMVGMALSPDDSRALCDVLCVLHSDAAFRNRVQLLFSAWFVGVLCHAKEATALETLLRKAGDDRSAARNDTDDVGSVALQAELDAADENDDEDAVEAVAAVPMFPALGAQAAAAVVAMVAVAAAAAGPTVLARAEFGSRPPHGPA